VWRTAASGGVGAGARGGGADLRAHLELAWEAPVTEPSRAPPVLEFESWSEVVGETAAPGGRLMGPVRASGPSRRSGGGAEGDFGGTQALAAAVGRGSGGGSVGLLWPGVWQGEQTLHFESHIRRNH